MNEQKVYSELALYGFSHVPSVFDSRLINLIRQELNEALKRNGNNFSSLHESSDQVILKSVFRNSPALFLKLFESKIVKAVCEIIFTDGFTLQSMNASLAKPNAGEGGIGCHIDSKYPAKGIENTTSLGIGFCIDDFDEGNGATLVWPFSHLTGKNPKDIIRSGGMIPKPNTVTAKSGDVIFFLSQTWHSVGKNHTSSNRWGIFSFINPWWVKPTWDFREIGEDSFNALSEFQKYLLGFYTQTPSMNSDRNYTKIEVGSLPCEYHNAKRFID